MPLLDLINPIDIGSKAVDSKLDTDLQCSDKHNAFKALLNNAQNEVSETTNKSSLLGSAMDIGLFALNTAPMLTAPSSFGLIQGLMNDGINSQFTELGAGLSTGFINALAGTGNSTATDTALQTDSLLDTAKSVVSGDLEKKDITQAVTNLGKHTLTDAQKLLFRNGTIPWQLDKERLLTLLQQNQS